MKRLFYLFVIASVLLSCSASKKTSQQDTLNKLKGENEMIVVKELGMPTQILHTRNGKVFVYENYQTGAFLTPNKSNFSLGDAGATFTTNVNTKTNKSQYTITSKASSTLRVYINSHGNCVKFEQSPLGEYGEMYHERFKHFNTK